MALRTIGELVANGAEAEETNTAEADAESGSDDDLWEDEDDGDYEDDDVDAGHGESPFAPAENSLLSDVVDNQTGDFIPAATLDLDYLLYDSPRKDPMYQTDAQVHTNL